MTLTPTRKSDGAEMRGDCRSPEGFSAARRPSGGQNCGSSAPSIVKNVDDPPRQITPYSDAQELCVALLTACGLLSDSCICNVQAVCLFGGNSHTRSTPAHHQDSVDLFLIGAESCFLATVHMEGKKPQSTFMILVGGQQNILECSLLTPCCVQDG